MLAFLATFSRRPDSIVEEPPVMQRVGLLSPSSNFKRAGCRTAAKETKSGRLLKEIEILETKEIAGRVVATETRISDMMKTDTETLMILSELKINIPLEDDLFSLAEFF